MSSREQLILGEFETRLKAAPVGAIPFPAGLTVSRARLRENTSANLPHASIYPIESTTDRRGSTSETALTVKVVLWGKGLAETPIDQVLDPLWLWAHQQLLTDESLGGLAVSVRPTTRTWGFALHQAPFGDLDLHFLVTYRHAAADPSRLP